MYRLNRAINCSGIAVTVVYAKHKPVDLVSVITMRERLLPVQELQKHGIFMVQLDERAKAFEPIRFKNICRFQVGCNWVLISDGHTMANSASTRRLQ